MRIKGAVNAKKKHKKILKLAKGFTALKVKSLDALTLRLCVRLDQHTLVEN